MFYSYSYDISDHTSNPLFSQDCNGKDSNAIPAVSGWSLGEGRGEEWSKGWIYSASSNSSKLFYSSFSKNSFTYLHIFSKSVSTAPSVSSLLEFSLSCCVFRWTERRS